MSMSDAVSKFPECPGCGFGVWDYEPGVSSAKHDGILWHPECLPDDAEDADDLLTRRLEKSVQATCKHQHETVVDARSTQSDTEIRTLHCPDCGRNREDEVIGSPARAENDEPTDPDGEDMCRDYGAEFRDRQVEAMRMKR
jgi:hypothetical protein